jgi:proteasome lid subunit RPN8/RPN11
LQLWLSEEHARRVVDHARAEWPREACGIIAGIDGRAARVIPLPNSAVDPENTYHLDDGAFTSAFFAIRRAGQSIVAFYHSHPHGDPLPSRTDRQLASYPDIPYLIVGLGSGHPTMQAWQLTRTQANPVSLSVGHRPGPDTPPPMSHAQRSAIVISAILALVLMLLISVTLLPPAPPIP